MTGTSTLKTTPPIPVSAAAVQPPKHPLLTGLGERVRALRAQRGMTRKALSVAAEVSERHLANLEYGIGNASVLVLLQVAAALQCTLVELLDDDGPPRAPEWLKIEQLLAQADDATLRRARLGIAKLLGADDTGDTDDAFGPARRSTCIALVGLRGAGKSTLGKLLAEDLGFPFVELSREIEKSAGCSINEIQNLYGQSAYRRHERRALEDALQHHPEAVIATPGGLVSDPATFQLLLTRCTTVWLQADPQDHMQRVVAQGDLRPMAGKREAMQDLRNILADRAAFYAQAEFQLNTSAAPLEASFEALRRLLRDALQIPA